MARYSITVESPWPAERAFGFVADLRNLPSWDPGIVASTQTAGDGPGPGAEYDVDAGNTTLRYRMTAFDPPRRASARGRNRFLTSIDTVTVAPAGAGSAVTWQAELVFNGPLRFLSPLLGPVLRRLGAKAAAGLAGALEGRRTG